MSVGMGLGWEAACAGDISTSSGCYVQQMKPIPSLMEFRHFSEVLESTIVIPGLRIAF